LISRSSIAAGLRASSPARVALSFGGVAFVVVQLIVGMKAGLFPIPGGDELIWDRVGDSVLTGTPIYYLAPNPTDSFWYAPPLAVLFATVSWLPVVLQHWLFTVLKIASLRLIAGSWVGAGIACWFPLVAFELGGGNFNLLIAAGIVLAIRGRPRLAVLGALAKLGPALAIDPRDWRKALPVALLSLAITLPWLHLWPEWIAHLVANLGFPLGPQIPIPFSVRVIAAAALLLISRAGWSRALAATLAIPAFYWGSLVILIAPLAVWLRTPRSAIAVAAPEPAT
jgi:hypothetical protein